MPAGRPTDYTPELADKICAGIADGDSLRTVCLAEDMPDKSTIFRWLRLHPEFRDQYARAKDDSTDAIFDELLDIADDGSNDWMETHDKDGNFIAWRENGEAIRRSVLRADVRKFMLAKIKPKKYGERIQQDVTGSLDINNMSEEQVNARLQTLFNAAAAKAPQC